MPGWMAYKLESRLLENINLRCVGDNTLMAESKKELKSLLMRVKKEGKKANLKLNIKKTKIMHLVPSLHANRRGKCGISDRFPLLGL